MDAAFDCYKMCCGCIGILKETIERSLVLKTNDLALKMSDLVAQALPRKRLIQIATEIKIGEEYFEDQDGSELERELGLDAPDKHIKMAKQKSSQGRVGERSPKRDKIGDHA